MPAPAPAPVPQFQSLPDGTYTGVLAGRLITFTATPMAFYTLYGDLPNSDPNISHAYISGNYNNWMNHFAISFVYVPKNGGYPTTESYVGTYLLKEDGTLVFTGTHGVATFHKVG